MNATRLQLQPLEDRLAPATAVYSAGTLTVTAATGDFITVNNNVHNVPGFLQVTAGPVIFDSGTTQPVKNLVLRAGTALNYDVLFGLGLVLNNVTAYGATFNTNMALMIDTQLKGNFTYVGQGNANDTVLIPNQTYIGGNVTVDLKAGNNLLDLGGGYIGGSVKVTGGVGNDTVNCVAGGDLTIVGNFTCQLGAGNNVLTSLSGQRIIVGRNLNYVGGTGYDSVDWLPNATPVWVGGSVSLNFGGLAGIVVLPAEFWNSNELFVGRHFTSRSGLGVNLYGPNYIGGNVSITANPTSGSAFTVGQSTIFVPILDRTIIGGNLTFAGGMGDDLVSLDNLAIHGNVNLNMSGGTTSIIDIGTTQRGRVEVQGSFRIGNSATTGQFNLMRLQMFGTFTAQTLGGDDRFWIDDSMFFGNTTFDLGAGNDTVRFEISNADGFGNLLNQRTRFEASLTIYGRDGNDAVTLGGVLGTGVNIGGAVRLVGGNGADDLALLPANVYLGATFEDFETGNNF